MNDGASVADAIAAKLASNGHVPTNGVWAEVNYVAIAKVTVINADGTLDTSYRHFDNLGDDVDTLVRLARRMASDADGRS